ncbi:hypothetical protein [Bacillus sp. AFS037270]|uniref:hypothetical protein n=1 Tax=Bacillus sp. AFS037270 TaxID=2033499 RepID=UPI000BFC46CB|nr:hypothetical protein [Bacillus sp. AFS037270]PGV53436.1 hypothetical protein COD92_07570 [Bacillus sp. AFS037270]
MHIRHFILMGVFLGAAAFLPNNVFAEKNEAAGQPVPQNSEVHTLVLEKIETPMASDKAVSVTPENVHKSQGGVVQKPETNPRTHQTVPTKPVQKSPNKTNRSIERAVPSSEKNINVGKPAVVAAKVKDTGQTANPVAKVEVAEKTANPVAKVEVAGKTGQSGRAKLNAVTNKIPAAPKSLSSNERNSEVETNLQTPGLNAKSENYTEEAESSILIKTSHSLTLVHKPLMDEENKTPSNNRKNPGEVEIMNNPPQRMQSSGGQSNEQFSPGAGTISFITNQFDWDENFGLNISHIYTSQQAKYRNQWINAPPSPPPKAAPFFLTFTAYLATCNDN